MEVFCKKMLLKILQNSQENTCVRVSFLNKVGGCRRLFLVKDNSMVSAINVDENSVKVTVSHVYMTYFKLHCNTAKKFIFL